MKILGILSLLLTLAVSTVKNCNENHYYGDDGDTTCTVKVDNFNRIVADGVASVFFTQGNEFNIEIEGDKISVECLKLEVINRTLHISDDTNKLDENNNKKHWWQYFFNFNSNYNEGRSHRINIYITAPDLEKVNMNGVGSFHIKDELTVDHGLDFNSDGVGSISLNSVSCGYAEIHHNGVGSLSINNFECDNNIYIDKGGVGSANINLKAQDVWLNSSGVGSVTLNTKCRKIEISASGVGSTTVYGTADDYSVIKKGIGSVNVSGLSTVK